MVEKEESPLIVALDVDNKQDAIKLVHSLINQVQIFKVGLQLYLAAGQGIIEIIHTLGGKVFLDLKFCDIPRQVANACVEVTKKGIFMFTVHITGGYEMMKEARTAVEAQAKQVGISRPKILGVTVLTSLDQKALGEIGISTGMELQTLKLAGLAQQAGLDGVVASPQEVKALRKKLGKEFLIVTPGIRVRGEEYYDQKRTMNPVQAIKLGSDYIVMGRSIISARDPASKVKEILEKVRSKP